MPAYPFDVPRPTIVRDLGETAVGLRTASGMLGRVWISNPSADTVGHFKGWDVLVGNLNTGTSRMLFDMPVPAGGTLELPDLPLENGFTARFTGATGAADVSAPDADAVIHDFREA